MKFLKLNFEIGIIGFKLKKHIGYIGDFGIIKHCIFENETCQPLTKGFVQLGLTLKQSSAVYIQALYSADVILPGGSSKHRCLVINLALVTGGKLVSSPTA